MHDSQPLSLRTKTILAWALAVCLGLTAAVPSHFAGAATIYSLDPQRIVRCQDTLMSSVPSTYNGLTVNDFLGANRFYAAGIQGQNSVSANVEAGYVWGGERHVGRATSTLATWPTRDGAESQGRG